MNKIILITALLCSLTFAHAVTNDKLLILGGELSNSAATCVDDIDEVMPRMKALGLNTVLVPAYWEFLEPTEGHFDYTLVDRVIEKARENDLKVIFLWFGVWKNSMSCYAPLWFKQDTKRFPRAATAEGKPLEIASCFSENVLQADNRAFSNLMKHIAATGRDVVTMVQVENEIGMLESARDYAKLANDIYRKGVPQELVSYLKKHQNTLHPWLSKRIKWPAVSTKQADWIDVFGDDIYTGEIFMAYYYAKYVETLAKSARSIVDIPLYVNAAMNSRGRQPGQYPSAGPLAHLIDLWHCGAPSLMLLAPDIYDTGFKGWADQYALPNNRLFIPESRCCENSGARAMYVFGEHQALGFSPFAIDQASQKDTESVTKSYALLRQIHRLPAFNTHSSKQNTWGLLFDQQDKERIIATDGISITCRHYFTLPWDARATDGSTWAEGGAILIQLNKYEYILAGTGVVVAFASEYEKEHEEQKVLGEDGFVTDGTSSSNKSKEVSKRTQLTSFKGTRIGIGYVDEVNIDGHGQIKYLRRHNGDQDHQGRHARISIGDWKILHIKLYQYE